MFQFIPLFTVLHPFLSVSNRLSFNLLPLADDRTDGGVICPWSIIHEEEEAIHHLTSVRARGARVHVPPPTDLVEFPPLLWPADRGKGAIISWMLKQTNVKEVEIEP